MRANLLDAIGPQRHDESLFARRVRFHQSWYRAVVLKLPRFGRTAGPVPRLLGSILTDHDAQAGRNFTSKAAQRLYERRRAEGWGVDPIRCTKYLTSSQTLTLNLFGPLQDSSTWFGRVLGEVLGRTDILDVKRLWVEYAPQRRSAYLHDMTRIDALVVMATAHGDELLAVEVKYSDRFNSRRVAIDTPPYRNLDHSLGLWANLDRTLSTREVNQLVRCHALAAAVSPDLLITSAVPGLLVLHHGDDATPRELIESYRGHLTDPTLARSTTLGTFVDALQSTATSRAQRAHARALQLRYVAECESQHDWMLSTQGR